MKILLIDANEMDYRYYKKPLSEAGYRLEWTTNTELPVDMTEEGIDLVLLDFDPDSQSPEDIHRLKSILPGDIPVLVMSYRAETDLVVKALELGACNYLVKPFEHTFLLGHIERALGKGAGKDPVLEYMFCNSSKLLEMETKKALRGNYPLSVLVITFVGLNTRFVPDRLMSVIEGALRPSDLVVCCGTGKAMVLLPFSDHKDAHEAAERVQKALDRHGQSPGKARFKATRTEITTYSGKSAGRNEFINKINLLVRGGTKRLVKKRSTTKG